MALALLVAEQARACGASAVGGVPVSAIPVACAALAAQRARRASGSSCANSARSMACSAGSRGRRSRPGERCLIVEDVVTTGGSTIEAIERVREEGLTVAGVVSVLDRLAGGGEAIQADARRGRAVYGAQHDRRGLSRSPRPCLTRVARASSRRPRRRAVLLELFGGLAEYEHLEHELRATEAGLGAALFGERPGGRGADRRTGRPVRRGARAEPAVLRFWDTRCSFPTFSSFLTSTGVWLEDLFVRASHRGEGVGRALLSAVAARALFQVRIGSTEPFPGWSESLTGFFRRFPHLPARLADDIPRIWLCDAVLWVAVFRKMQPS